MSVTSVGSSDSQSLGSVILQSLLSTSATGSQSTDALSSLLGDQVSLSSASLDLSKAPAAVTDAMNDLFSTQKDVEGDVTTLKAYFKDNPSSLTTLLGALQGSGSTYSAAGSLGASSSTLLAALAKAKAGGADTSSILTALLASQQQDPLLASIGGSDTSSQSSLMSLLG